MEIRIIAVGTLKEKYWKDACAEYLKRLQPYARTQVIEVADEKAPENLSDAQREQILRKEGERVLAKIRERDHVIALCIEGKMIAGSEALARELEQVQFSGKDLCFVIGGSLGLHGDVTRRANVRMSFSHLTFPHQLCRVILLEQVYRGFRIMKHEPYHK